MTSSFSIKYLFVVVGVLALLSAVVGYYVRFANSIADGYAQHEAAVLVVRYMEQNEGKWPRSWEELEPQFAALNSNGTSTSIAELRRAVFIDFTARVDELQKHARANDRPTFDVIHAIRTTDFSPFAPPNVLIYEYLRKTGGNATPKVE